MRFAYANMAMVCVVGSMAVAGCTDLTPYSKEGADLIAQLGPQVDKVLADNDSLYNTPPCFGIYMIKLVTEWLINDIGGLDKMEARNRAKAGLLYDAIDGSGGFYKGHAQKDCRSLMNVTFTLPNEDLEKAFVKQATANGMVELKGPRSVGGCRASIYNAFPAEGVDALVSFMREFEKKNG